MASTRGTAGLFGGTEPSLAPLPALSHRKVLRLPTGLCGEPAFVHLPPIPPALVCDRARCPARLALRLRGFGPSRLIQLEFL